MSKVDDLKKCEIELFELFDRADDLVELIDRHFFEKCGNYLLEAYFLTLRELYRHCDPKNFSLFNCENAYFSEEKSIFNIIVNIRNAIGHRSSPLNEFSDCLRISGARIFQENDVLIQYGKNNIFLVNGLFAFHKKIKQMAKDKFPYIKRRFENEFLPDRMESVMSHISEMLSDEEFVRLQMMKNS